MSNSKDETGNTRSLSRRSLLKWSGALAATGIVGIGLGFGGDLLLRPNVTSTSTSTTTAPGTTKMMTGPTTTSTATVTQPVTATVTQPVTTTLTQPPSTITQTITKTTTSSTSTNTPAPGTWVNTLAGPETAPVKVRVVNGVAVEIQAQDGIPYWNKKAETRNYAELDALYRPDKIQYPMKRTGTRGQGQFARTTWADVENIIATQMQTYLTAGHPEYVAMLSSASTLSAYVTQFLYSYGSPNSFSSGSTYCTPDGSLAATVTSGGTEGTDDWASAQYALLINTKLRTRALGIGAGANCDRLAVALNNGLKSVTVGPVLDQNAYLNGNEWVPIQPGTDSAFVLGLMNQIVTDNAYDVNFIQKFTNSAILIGPDGITPLVTGGKYQVWDLSTNSARAIDAAGTFTGSPALTGTYTVNGSTYTPAFQLFINRLASYTPALASAICGVPAAKITEIAKNLENYKPADLILDAINPSARWTNALQNKRALKLLPMLLGTHDKPGGRYYSYSGGTGITTQGTMTLTLASGSTANFPLSFPPRYASSTASSQARVDYDANLYPGQQSSQLLKNAILTGQPYPIKMLFIQGATALASNPPASVWRQCFASSNLDLIVFAGIWYEDDTDYADVILPEAQAFERMAGYSGFATITVDNPENVHQEFSFLAAAQQVVTPAGDVEPCTQYFPEIAALLSPSLASYFPSSLDTYLNFELAPMGITIAQLRQQGVYYPTPLVTKQVIYGTKTSWSISDGFFGAAATSRLNLYSMAMANAFKNGMTGSTSSPYYMAAGDPHVDPLPKYVTPTRTLTSGQFYSSGTYHFLHKQRRDQGYPHLTDTYLDGEVRQTSVWINSTAAAALGIKDGDTVQVTSPVLGISQQLPAKVTQGIHPSMIQIYTGFGRVAVNMDSTSRAKQGANDANFVPVNYSLWTGGGARNEAPVTVTKVTG